jgi:hypothetical protein
MWWGVTYRIIKLDSVFQFPSHSLPHCQCDCPYCCRLLLITYLVIVIIAASALGFMVSNPTHLCYLTFIQGSVHCEDWLSPDGGPAEGLAQ